MATRGRSQAESEAPAKVYQLDALDSKIDVYQEETNKKLDTLINQTKGVITLEQAHVMIKEALSEAKSYTDGEIEKVNLEYGPTKKGAWWLAGILVAQAVAQFGIIIFKPFG